MSDLSPRLSLPLIQPSQAQKHVTHNEALDQLDLLVQLVVEAFEANDPPVAPVDGTVWALGSAPTLAWAGQEGRLASWRNGGWRFVAPQSGWRAWGRADATLRVFDGTAWIDPIDSGDLQNLSGVGIAATSDSTNRLTVAAPASLFTHAGSGGHQVKVNKASAADTASLLFQSDFSGRAEIGLAGNDDLAIKVSADGTDFVEALRVTRTSGRVNAPAGLDVTGAVTGTAVTQSALDPTIGRLMRVGDFGLGTPIGTSQPAVSLNAALIPGQYGYLATDQNAPSINSGMVVVMRYATLSIRQEASPASIDLRFQRYSLDEGATWSPWRPVYTSGNILGTVAQVGGVPTGAVIQQGSNANGTFTRFADGTQICVLAVSPTLTCDTAEGALFRSSTERTWTFPIAFVNASSVAVSGGALAAGRWLSVRRDTATTALYRQYAAVSSATAVASALQAIGRWF